MILGVELLMAVTAWFGLSFVVKLFRGKLTPKQADRGGLASLVSFPMAVAMWFMLLNSEHQWPFN